MRGLLLALVAGVVAGLVLAGTILFAFSLINPSVHVHVPLPKHSVASEILTPPQLQTWANTVDVRFAYYTATVDVKVYRDDGPCQDTRHVTGTVTTSWLINAGGVTGVYSPYTGGQTVTVNGAAPQVLPPGTFGPAVPGGVFTLQDTSGLRESDDDGLCSQANHLLFRAPSRSPELDAAAIQYAALQPLSSVCVAQAFETHDPTNSISAAATELATSFVGVTPKSTTVVWSAQIDRTQGDKKLAALSAAHKGWKFVAPTTCLLARGF